MDGILEVALDWLMAGATVAAVWLLSVGVFSLV